MFGEKKYSLVTDFGDAVLAKQEGSTDLFFIIQKLDEIFKVQTDNDEIRVLLRGDKVFVNGITIGIKKSCDLYRGQKHIFVKKSNRTMTIVVDKVTLLRVFIPAFG